MDLAIVVFAVPTTLMAIGLATAHGRPLALAAIPLTASLVLFRTRPLLAGGIMVSASLVLRVAYIGIGYSTQIDHAKSAARRAWDGFSPYGVLLPSATTAPEPFTNGPLALLWWQTGPTIEFAAAAAIMAVLVSQRAWITLALFAGLPFSVFLTTTGVNDYSPALLITCGLLLLRSRPVTGGIVLAAAAGLKPYAVAWFIPAIGYSGLRAGVALLATTAVVWSPLLFWGPSSFIQSIQLHSEVHPVQANALNIPVLRWLAVPVAVIGAFARQWDLMVLAGSGAFLAFLFLDRWASLGYLLAVIPIAGIALEGRFGAREPRVRQIGAT